MIRKINIEITRSSKEFEKYGEFSASIQIDDRPQFGGVIKMGDLVERIRDYANRLDTRRVLCIYCKKPIHIDNWAGIHKRGMFCKNTICLTAMLKEGEEGTYNSP